MLMLHALQLGGVTRAIEAVWTYRALGRVEEPYCSLVRKIRVSRDGKQHHVIREVSRLEGRLYAHRAAFARAMVLMAFLGSAPQLTLQAYITLQQHSITAYRGVLMAVSLLSVSLGALVLTLLAVRVRFDRVELRVSARAVAVATAWRAMEISTRVTVLVLFSSACREWTLAVVLVNLAVFGLLPWVGLWRQRRFLPEHPNTTY
ncbi:endoplasmic reticulum membrane adapter protein XK-like, partial [Lampetra planeri]